MKNKLSKIIFIIIFLGIVLLALGRTVKAKTNIDGREYYTKNDIRWVGSAGNGYIHVDGLGDLYCRKHGASLTGYLGRDDVFSKTVNSGATFAVTEDLVHTLLQGLKMVALSGTPWANGGTLRALELIPHNWTTVTRRNEAALYAFADKYYTNPSAYVQKALWQFINKYEDASCKTEGSTSLFDAAEYYDQKWIPNNKADLKGDQTQAKSRVLGNDYIAGPFTITYNTATYDKIIFSWIERYAIKVTDKNGNTMSTSASITDKDGKGIGEIPNGKPFYIKVPYNQNIGRIGIDVTVKYIDDVSAQKLDVTSIAHEFGFVWDNDNIWSHSQFHHASDCKYQPNVVQNDVESCSGCSGYVTKIYFGSCSGRVRHLRTLGSGIYQNMRKIKGDVKYAESTVSLYTPVIPLEIEIAGDVWEDMPESKSQKINGIKDGNDVALKGIEVRLYRKDTGELAHITKGTNPTLTDANGHYEFHGVNATYKYYVEFVYDGIIYTNTYGGGVPEYNTPAWNATSKGSEVVSEREALNKKFMTISSYPMSYKVPRQIFDGNYLTNGYNRIFDLSKDIVNEEGIVQRYKNAVSAALQNYLNSHNRLDGDDTYIREIYGAVINSASDKTQAKQVLQYIWDCRIKAYAGYESEQDGKTLRAGGKYYPVYDRFAITDNNGNRITANNSTTLWQGYPVIYNGQLHINLGLIRRPTTDLELTEDLHQAIVSINGQDETYSFGTFDKKGLKINGSDAQISQNVATADYNYSTTASKLSSELAGDGTAAYPENYAPIQMYITYRINVKNKSSMPTSINEIVAYIDTNYYSYSDTYKTTGGYVFDGIRGSFTKPKNDTESEEIEYDKRAMKLTVSEHSKYGTGSETGGNLGIGKELFIQFGERIILENNEMASVYITYRLGENSTSHSKFNCTYSNPKRPNDANHAYTILQDSLEKGNEDKKLRIYTRAEVNAYSTFFKKTNDVKSTQDKYTSYYSYTSLVQNNRLSQYRAAGVLDAVSIPGNLNEEQLRIFNEENNKKTENDWDRASAFVIVDPNSTRTVKGNVWETVGSPANYWLENKSAYPKYEGTNGSKDITAELIEIKDGKETVRARTKTNGDGSYAFTEYIPGQYVVRFIYGDTAKYDTEQYSNYTKFTLNGVEYKCAYNGQFYQSGKANPNTNSEQYPENNRYWYANETDLRYSDAYDEVNRRIEVNNLLNTYKYNDVLSALKNPTRFMAYAYTSPLDVEVEYAKENTNAGEQNPAYTIANVDFALTPRTESKLKINKKVTHLKLVLQNGVVQFDADTKTIREQGVPAVVQAAQGHDINISMSSELVNGATLEITYTITVTNIGPKDTITYYTDTQMENASLEELQKHAVALGFYEEDPTNIVYYESKMRTYDNYTRNIEGKNVPRFAIRDDATWVSLIESGRTEMKDYNVNNKQTVETTTRAVEVADFVSNNLNFIKQSYTGAILNEVWDLETRSKEEFEKTYYKQYDEEKAMQPIIEESKSTSSNQKEMDSSEVYDSNTIVISNNKNALVNADLKSGESVSEDIVLSKVISVNDNSSDTKSYNNKARIIKINNTVSKIQDMAGADENIGPKLIDKSENVIVSDPTGIGNIYLGIILALAVTAIIGTGIILIKKFVITKR